MTKTKLFIPAFALILMAMASTACTGFADGPAISFQSTTTRLANTWEVKEAAQNGVDITSQFVGDNFEFKTNGVYQTLDAAKLISTPPFTRDTLIPLVGSGEWNLLSKNELELLYSFQFRDIYNNDVIYKEELYERWEITRLTDEQLWLRNDSTLVKMEFFVP
ncbi:MAG: hypothetical protein AAF927_28230 [Bacteroidota bacterium]